MTRRSLPWLFPIFLLLPPLARPQSPDALPSNTPGTASVSEWMTGEAIPAIPGIPFSAKALLETVSHLEDGTVITHNTYNLIARDSLGRTHNEARNWAGPDGTEPRLIRINLYDPASKTRTDLFPLTKIARQWTLSSVPAAANAAVRPETTRENLGTQTMEGLSVNGTRVTQTFSASILGNDRPLSIVTEYWYSPELHLNLLTTRSDPRHGHQTVRVTELVSAEPDSALFDIPSDYKVVTEPVPLQQAQGPGAPDQNSPTAKSGIARAGVNGASIPKCVYCPSPSYTDEARSARIQGSVVLQVTVTPEGRAENISVVRKIGYGLEQNAIDAVSKWQFKPAVGPNGTPVATIVPIEVTFRLGPVIRHF